ncbi:Kae1-associated serine/threonine protein kinase [Candidatus Woesearchaeota archaeon]|nr:Kae1-associated serine/threonine protein kinase [Candidatus Woesearchaeota archaeon]
MTIIGQGAEAIISKQGKGADTKVVKDRVVKGYRHHALDKELRKSRSRREKKILEKAASLVPVPKVLSGNDEEVIMEFIEGSMVKELLNDNIALAEEIGRLLGILHSHHIMHGDLTTSNMIYRDEKIVLIDFGLSFISHKPEDKAVDIHLFKQALESKHHTIHEQAYKLFLKGYRTTYNDKEAVSAVLERLKKVESRGRNKGLRSK